MVAFHSVASASPEMVAFPQAAFLLRVVGAGAAENSILALWLEEFQFLPWLALAEKRATLVRW